MTEQLRHEEAYRGFDAITKLAKARVVVCGIGAVGSNLVDNLVRQSFHSVVTIDSDRVEEHNVAQQRYGRKDVGAKKTTALASLLYRDLGVLITAFAVRLDEHNVAKYLQNAKIIVDAFDNHASRQLLQDYSRDTETPCLHIGLAADFAEVIFDSHYRVPADQADQAGLDLCAYPLARNICLLAVAVASEVLIDFVLSGTERSYRITLRDRRITPV